MLGVVFAQLVHPPLRVVPHRLRIGVGPAHQRIALAQKAAQATVDKTGLVGSGRSALSCLHSLVDQRVRRVRGIFFAPNQRQHHAQKRIGFRRGRLFGKLLAERFGSPQPAKRVKAQGLHPRAKEGVYTLKRFGQ